MNDYTDLLYARPSFIEGIARVIDLGGTLQEYNYARDGEDPDRRAFAADFRAIGQDIRQALVNVFASLGPSASSDTR